MEQSIFGVAGGSRALLDLARAWHRRCMQDEVVSHALDDAGLPEDERLRSTFRMA